MAGSRRGARRMLVQALYQAQLSGHEVTDLLTDFADHPDGPAADTAYFEALLPVIAAARSDYDAQIDRYGLITAGKLDPVEKAVLWVGLAELQHSADVPTKVVINEAIELAKVFGAEGGYKYVNSVLDKAAAELR